jgi:hypothetical protein
MAMTRRVIGASVETLRGAWNGSHPRADGYLARLVKYVPAETLVLYVAAAGLFADRDPAFLGIVALLCLAGTPIYLRWATSRGGRRPLRLQMVLATLAFPLWVFALGGPFTAFDWYAGARVYASALLLGATFAFPLAAPRPGE